MVRWQFYGPVCLLISLAWGAGARADAVADWEKRHEQQKHAVEQSLNEIPALDAKNAFRRPQDLFWIRVESKELVLRTPLPTTPPPGFVKVKLAGLGAWVRVQVMGGAPRHKPFVVPQYFNLVCNDYSHPRQALLLNVSAGMQGLSISQSVQTPDGLDLVQLNQQQTLPGTARSRIVQFVVTHSPTDRASATTTLPFTAPDFFTLLREHPREVEQHLRPLMHELGQEAVFAPDASVAWQVFAEHWEPSSAAAAKVNALLPSLDSSDFRDRERAQSELNSMGREGAAALIRLNRKLLSAEQNVRVDQVLTPYRQLTVKEALRLRSDRAFLLDCLYCDDPEICSAALSRLREMTGQEIPFDLDARLNPRIAAVNALREKLTGAAADPKP